MTAKIMRLKHPEAIRLESGVTLPEIDVAYHEYGTLSAKKDNVILICHPLTGDSDALTWWSRLVGPGCPIDTNHYYVLCSNALGSCYGTTGPSSIDPRTSQPYGLSFPIITITDMVAVQRQWLAQLGIDTIKMVIGGSMGGMQALEWVAQCPHQITACVPIASTAKVSPLAIAFDSVGRNAILSQLSSDTPSNGLSIARQLGHITYLSEDALESKFSRRLQDSIQYGYKMTPEFQVESYLNYQGDKFTKRFDMHAYLYLTKAVSYFDLERTHTSLELAFKKTTAKFLLLAIQSDWLYTPNQSKYLAYELMKLNKHVSFVLIDSKYGHDTFLIDSDETNHVISRFMESL